MSKSHRAEGSSNIATSIHLLPGSKQGLLKDGGRIEQLAPKAYARRVYHHADRSSKTSLYPGQNYENLADYLWRPFGESRPRTTSKSNERTSGEGGQCFAAIHSLRQSGRTIIYLDNVDDFLRSSQEEEGQEGRNRLLFLRGFASAEWLNAVGSRYSVDPEFLQRHLDLVSTIGKWNYYPLPSLPSSSSNIIRLRITTIGYRDASFEALDQDKLDALRAECARDMDHYLSQIKSDRLEHGDSVVRRFSVHDRTHFSLEQDISLCVSDSRRGWTIIAWLDNGRALGEYIVDDDIPKMSGRRWSPTISSHQRRDEESQVRTSSTRRRGKYAATNKTVSQDKALGPWQKPVFSPSKWGAALQPTIQHYPGMALDVSGSEHQIENDINNAHCFHQSGSLFHRAYGATMDEETFACDAFYALHEFFTFKAFSEVQFLNMVEATLAPETGHLILQQKQPSLSNLLYHNEILLSHAQELRANIDAITNRGSDVWPKATKECLERVAEAAKEKLLHDFKELLDRTELLSSRCDQGMMIISNNAMLMESKRAISQAQLVSRLTLLAYFYIPLSFTSSFFGMNFSQFNSGSSLSMWVYFVTSVPLLCLSFAFLKIDIRLVLLRFFRVDEIIDWTRRALG